MVFLSAMDKTSPFEVGDRTKCNEVQGDDREKPTSTKNGGKARLMALPENLKTFYNRHWSSPWLAVYAARRPSFKREFTIYLNYLCPNLHQRTFWTAS